MRQILAKLPRLFLGLDVLLATVIILAAFLLFASCRRISREPDSRSTKQEDNRDSTAHSPGVSTTEGDHAPPRKKRRKYRRYCQRIKQLIVNRDNWTVFFTAVLAIATAVLTYIAFNTDTAVHESAKAANDANKLNAAGLRPWVYFDNVTSPNDGKVIFVNSEEIIIKLAYSFRNSGRLPAKFTNEVFLINPLIVQQKDDLVNISGRQREACGKLKIRTSGFTIFPEQPPMTKNFIAVSRREPFDTLAKRGVTALILISGCVEYQLAEAGEYGETGVSLLIARGNELGIDPLALPAEGGIDLKDLVIRRLPMEIAD